jgi:hypothetical protein
VSNISNKYSTIVILYAVSRTQDDKGEPETTYPEGNWKRKTSYGMGEYLKMDDEVRITRVPEIQLKCSRQP